MLPLSIGVLLTSIATPPLGRKVYPRYLIQGGLVLLFVGGFILARALPDAESGLDLALGLLVAGLAIGIIAGQLPNLILSGVGQEEASEASGLQGTAQNVGMAVGTAVVGMVIITVALSSLGSEVEASDVIPANLKDEVAEVLERPFERADGNALDEAIADLDAAQQAEIKDIFDTGTLRGFQGAILAGGIVALIGALLAFRLPLVKLEGGSSAEETIEQVVRNPTMAKLQLEMSDFGGDPTPSGRPDRQSEAQAGPAPAQERSVSADARAMGREAADGVVCDNAPWDRPASQQRPPLPPEGVAQRVRSRTESLLRVVDRRAHLLLGRNLTSVETAEITAAGEAMAALFGRIGHPDLARLARDLVEIFAGEGPWGPTTAIEVAATCEDLRALLDSAIGQYHATASRGGLVVVIGEPTEEVDALCWVAHTRGYAIVHADESIPDTDDRPVAVVVSADGGFSHAIRALLLAVNERWVSPVIVLHRGAEWSTIRRLARYGAVVLPLAIAPGDVIDELSRVVAAGRLEPVALLCGNVPVAAEQRLQAHGFAASRVDDPDRLPEALGRAPGVVVLGPATGAAAASAIAHLIRADPAARHNPIVWIDRRAGLVLPPRLDVSVVDELDDALAARIGAQLRRRAGDISEVGNVGNRILEWAAADVLIDRALVAAHRTGRQVALATIRLDPSLDRDRITELEEVLSNEFRLDDILGRRGDRTMVLALGGVPRIVAARRLTSLLERLALSDGEARVGVALFPSDGRSAIDLVGAAHRAAKRAADHDGPVVVATTWRPESDEVDVMVVDADPVLSQVMVDLLQGSGLRAMLCASGPEALAALRSDEHRVTPRLLLLDLDVRGIDGLGMLRELRTAGLLSQIRVLLMMARFSEADLRVALDIGAADVISKPLSATLLLHRVRFLLGEET